MKALKRSILIIALCLFYAWVRSAPAQNTQAFQLGKASVKELSLIHISEPTRPY